MQLSNNDMTVLYDLHAGDLLRFFARRTLDEQAAVDLVGETYAEALATRSGFRGKTLEDARPWLFGIARNLLRGYYRKGRVELDTMQKLQLERVELSAEDAAEIERHASLAEVRTAIATALEKLKDEYREAVELRVMERLEYAEIAARLDVSEQVVRARVSRGLKRLRTEIESAGLDEELRNG